MVIMCSLLWFVLSRIKFPNTNPRGLYWEGLIIGGVFVFQIWGLPHGGACTGRGLFSEFNLNF